MPWSCEACARENADSDALCSDCGTRKLAWTVVADKTRTLAISAAKFSLLRGTGTAPTPANASAEVELVATEEAVALPKRLVADLAARGLLPASRDVLFVALYPRGARDLSVGIELLYAGEPSDELEFPEDAPEALAKDAVLYRRFAFVHGDEELDELEGIEWVDVSEGDDAFAPELEVSALGRQPLELPLRAVQLRAFAFSS